MVKQFTECLNMENYVNALVDEATEEHQNRMKNCFSQFENVITDDFTLICLFMLKDMK